MPRRSKCVPRYTGEKYRDYLFSAAYNWHDGFLTEMALLGAIDYVIDTLADQVDELKAAVKSKAAQIEMVEKALRQAHEVIADSLGLIDPEDEPDLVGRINAILLPCDEAKRCPVVVTSGGEG